MKKNRVGGREVAESVRTLGCQTGLSILLTIAAVKARCQNRLTSLANEEDGDVPGWVLVVLMTTGLVTAIWTIAAPKLSSILRNSLDSMNGIH